MKNDFAGRYVRLSKSVSLASYVVTRHQGLKLYLDKITQHPRRRNRQSVTIEIGAPGMAEWHFVTEAEVAEQLTRGACLLYTSDAADE